MEAMLVIFWALVLAVKQIDKAMGDALEVVYNKMNEWWIAEKEEAIYWNDRKEWQDREIDRLSKELEIEKGANHKVNRDLQYELDELKRNRPNYDDVPSWRVSVPLEWMKEHRTACIKALRCAYETIGLKEAKDAVELKIEAWLPLFESRLNTKEMVAAVKSLTEANEHNKMSTEDGLVIEKEWDGELNY
jgi:ribosomal protein L7/L12